MVKLTPRQDIGDGSAFMGKQHGVIESYRHVEGGMQRQS